MTRAHRLALPLVIFMFGLIALGIALFVTLKPGGNPSASGIGGAFSLTASDGRVVTDKDLPGAPSLVFFGFTRCPDVCPTTLQDITLVYDALGPDGDRLRSFLITVDPERDTPATLATYLSSFDRRIVGLSGDRAATDAAIKAFRAYAKRVPLADGDYTMDHTALVYIMDKSGRFAGSLNLDRPPAEAAKDIRRYF
jgi:protein SCO1